MTTTQVIGRFPRAIDSRFEGLRGRWPAALLAGMEPAGA
jgi:hypothetical protein